MPLRYGVVATNVPVTGRQILARSGIESDSLQCLEFFTKFVGLFGEAPAFSDEVCEGVATSQRDC